MRPTGQTSEPRVGDGRWHDRPPEERALASTRSQAYETAIGIDLSYSGKGDRAAVVVVSRETQDDHRDRYFVRAAWSGPKELRSFRLTLAAYQSQYPGAHMVSFVSGTERAVLMLLAEESRDEHGQRVPPVDVMPMLANDAKAVRAAGTIELWNQGRIIVPRTDWAEKLVRAVQSFDGAPSHHDDEVDALVSAVAFLRLCGGGAGPSVGLVPSRRGR